MIYCVNSIEFKETVFQDTSWVLFYIKRKVFLKRWDADDENKYFEKDAQMFYASCDVCK